MVEVDMGAEEEESSDLEIGDHPVEIEEEEVCEVEVICVEEEGAEVVEAEDEEGHRLEVLHPLEPFPWKRGS